MKTVVLAGSRTETSAFVQDKQLDHNVRHITNRDTLRAATRPTEVHILPSYWKRRDVHALRSSLDKIRRQNPDCLWYVYEKAGSEYNVIPGAEADFSPNAVPAQTSVGEFLEVPLPEQNFRSDPFAEVLKAGEVEIGSVEAGQVTADKIDAAALEATTVVAEPEADDDLPDWLK